MAHNYTVVVARHCDVEEIASQNKQRNKKKKKKRYKHEPDEATK